MEETLGVPRPTLHIPRRAHDLPDGYTRGDHVSLATGDDARWIIRDRDDARCVAQVRPDLDEAPTAEEIDAAMPHGHTLIDEPSQYAPHLPCSADDSPPAEGERCRVRNHHQRLGHCACGAVLVACEATGRHWVEGDQ